MQPPGGGESASATKCPLVTPKDLSSLYHPARLLSAIVQSTELLLDMTRRAGSVDAVMVAKARHTVPVAKMGLFHEAVARQPVWRSIDDDDDDDSEEAVRARTTVHFGNPFKRTPKVTRLMRQGAAEDMARSDDAVSDTTSVDSVDMDMMDGVGEQEPTQPPVDEAPSADDTPVEAMDPGALSVAARSEAVSRLLRCIRTPGAEAQRDALRLLPLAALAPSADDHDRIDRTLSAFKRHRLIVQWQDLHSTAPT